MVFSSWLRNRTSTRPAARRPAKPIARFRPQLESLDGRFVPTTLTVTNGLGFGPGSLRDTIAAAQSGDTIVFDPGVNAIQVNTNAPFAFGGSYQIVIDRNLDIEGPGAGNLLISGGNVSRVFDIVSGVQATISGLSIVDGNGTWGGWDPAGNDQEGGGILNYGTLTINSCDISGNSTGPAWYGEGGGVANFGTLTVNNSVVSGNSSAYGGGIFNVGTLTVSGSAVSGNTAMYLGGGVYNSRTTPVNSTGTVGAGTVTISANSVTQNTAGNGGGGIYVGKGAYLTLLTSTVTGNLAPDGADILDLGHFRQKGSRIGQISYK